MSRFELLCARADAARLLAACYYEPESAFEAEGVFKALIGATTCIDVELGILAKRLRTEFNERALEALLLDYAALFIGPSAAKAPPYGSIWLDDRVALNGDSTVDVNALYAEAGFGLVEEFRDLPDHIAVELEFLYTLLFRLAGAETSTDILRIESVKARLLQEHLMRWAPQFTGAVEEGANTGFYRTLAELTRRFVAAVE